MAIRQSNQCRSRSDLKNLVWFYRFLVYLFPSRKHVYIILIPLKPHFYIVKLGFTEVYIIFLISAQKHKLWVLVRTAEAVLTSTHNLCFEQKYEEYQNFLSENFHFLEVRFSVYLNRHVFVMPYYHSLIHFVWKTWQTGKSTSVDSAPNH